MFRSSRIRTLVAIATYSSHRLIMGKVEIEYPIWINISLFIGCLVETRNYGILSLAFIATSFRVSEENLVFETVQSGPYSSFEYFLCSLRN